MILIRPLTYVTLYNSNNPKDVGTRRHRCILVYYIYIYGIHRCKMLAHQTADCFSNTTLLLFVTGHQTMTILKLFGTSHAQNGGTTNIYMNFRPLAVLAQLYFQFPASNIHAKELNELKYRFISKASIFSCLAYAIFIYCVFKLKPDGTLHYIEMIIYVTESILSTTIQHAATFNIIKVLNTINEQSLAVRLLPGFEEPKRYKYYKIIWVLIELVPQVIFLAACLLYTSRCV